MKKFVTLLVALFIYLSAMNIYAQERIAFLPFQNMDGNMDFNGWCYELQDSLQKSFLYDENNGVLYQVVPADSIDLVMAELNVDPTNPEYPSDMWKAVEKLNCSKVISGNFNVQSNRFLINAYIYDVNMKLPDPRFQARDIFKPEEKILSSIKIITKRLMPAFNPN